MTQQVLSLFTGGGGMDKGFQQAGFDIVASNEIDPISCQTLEYNFDHDVIAQSIHRISIETLRKEYGRPTGIIGGFPCQVYSKAADIHGARAQSVTFNPKMLGNVAEKIPTYSKYAWYGGELFLHFFRMVANLQPDWFVIENVPDILGATIVRETFKNTPCNKTTLGYYYQLHEGIENAKDYGVPQDRPRYFLAGAIRDGSNGKFKIRKPETRRKLVPGDILEENPQVDMPRYAMRRLMGLTCRDRPIITKASPDAIAPTVVAHYAKDRGTRLVEVDGEIRPYTALEMARLQGFPDDYVLQGTDNQKYVQAGNAVAVPVAYAIAQGIKELFN